MASQDPSLDMDEVAKLAREHKPKLIIAGASAFSPISISPRFRDRQRSRLLSMVDMAHIAGLVAAKVHPILCLMPTSPRRRTKPCAARVAA